jgi:hypothetical protein
MADINDTLNKLKTALGIFDETKALVVPIVAIEKIEKAQDYGKSNRGGKRLGSGRKKREEDNHIMTKMETIDAHANEIIDIVEHDKSTGKTKIVKKTSAVAVLDKTRSEAMKGNITALKEMNDRYFGRPVQPLFHGFDENRPLRIEIDI